MANLILNGSTSGSVTLSSPAVSGTTTLTLPATTGNVIVSTAVSTSILGTVTNKITININGTTYYLLASTSGT
jgi:hypothetical protein